MNNSNRKLQGLNEHKATGHSVCHINAHNALVLLLPFPEDPSRRIAIVPQRLTRQGSHTLNIFCPGDSQSGDHMCAYIHTYIYSIHYLQVDPKYHIPSLWMLAVNKQET